MLSTHCKKISCLFFLLVFFYGCKRSEDTLRICFTGDLLLDRGVRQQINLKGVPYLFKEVKSIFSASDYVVANLECPVTKEKHPVYKRYIFRAEPEWLADVKDAGITHLVMANNHTYDQGRIGLKDTRDNIIKNHMIPVGFGTNQQHALEPVIIEKNGIKVALFSSVLLPLENWSYLPDSAGICQASVAELAEAIRNYRSKNPGTKLVAILHWGAEFQQSPGVEQRQQARELIDAGADAIIGHHPHVIQEKQMYKGRPVFFSLGNFVFDQSYPSAKKGLIVELLFSKDETKSKEIPFTINNGRPEP